MLNHSVECDFAKNCPASAGLFLCDAGKGGTAVTNCVLVQQTCHARLSRTLVPLKSGLSFGYATFFTPLGRRPRRGTRN